MSHDVITLSSDDDVLPATAAAAPTLQTATQPVVGRGKAARKPAAKRTEKRSRGDAVVGAGSKRARKDPAQQAPRAPAVRTARVTPDADTLFKRYEPHALGELITSRDRNDKVMKWMESCRAPLPRSKVMLLYGPPGCGKTTLVRVAAAQHGLGLRVWKKDELQNEVAVSSQIDLFRRALLFDRMQSRDVVGETRQQKLMVFEGTPDCTTSYQQEMLQDTLRSFVAELGTLSTGLENPVVILFTTYGSHSMNYLKHQHFPDEFLASHRIQQLEVHGVTAAAMKRRLTVMANAECSTRLAATDCVKHVMQDTEADFRQAVHNLAFRLLTPRPADYRPRHTAPQTTHQAVPEDASASDAVPTHEALDIGHAAARILSAKRDEAGNLQHTNAETLTLSRVTAEKLTDYVHHNMPRYSQIEGGIDKMASVGRCMSDANVYSATLDTMFQRRDWSSSCVFLWGVHRHALGPAPSRSKQFEQCHPPPRGIDAQAERQVLRRVMGPSMQAEDAVYHRGSAYAIDMCPMLNRLVFVGRQRRYLPLPPPHLALLPPPRFGGAASGPGVVPLGGHRSPPKRPVPFVQPVKANQRRPVPFVPGGAARRPQAAQADRPQPREVRLTQKQLEHLWHVGHFTFGEWQRAVNPANNTRLPIALKWTKPPAPDMYPGDLRDRRTLVEELPADDLYLHAKEIADDPIED